MAKVETGTQARQAEKGRPALYVLIGTLILCAIATAGVLVWQGSNSPGTDNGSKSQEAARETVTGSTNPANRESPANPTQPSPAKPNAQ